MVPVCTSIITIIVAVNYAIDTVEPMYETTITVIDMEIVFMEIVFMYFFEIWFFRNCF